MSYPTEVRIPIQAGTVEVLRAVLGWAKKKGVTDVPVVLDNGTLGTVPFADLRREGLIAEKMAQVATLTEKAGTAESMLATAQAALDELTAQRP